jgi:DNA repair exonuclease SbcCD ATPase subunit
MPSPRHLQLITIINYDELDAIEGSTFITNYSSQMLSQQEEELTDLEDNRAKLEAKSEEIQTVIERLTQLKQKTDKTLEDHVVAIHAKIAAVTELKRAHISPMPEKKAAQ